MSPSNNPTPPLAKWTSMALRLFLLLPALVAPIAYAQNEGVEKKGGSPYERYLTRGPATGDLGAIAQVRIPDGFVFLNAGGTGKLLTDLQNIVSGDELGLIGPAGLPWFVVFQYDATGYVRDDEKGSLNADKMIDNIRRSDEAGNKERASRGWPAMRTVGWAIPPHYDEKTQNLEWAIKFKTEDRISVNHNTRILGRGGVMRVTLVCGPDELEATLPGFKKLLADYAYKSGNKYAEFRAGDKVAEYGLSALVAGGAAAVALKSGLLAKFWKGIVFAALAAGSFLKKIIAKIRGDRDTSP